MQHGIYSRKVDVVVTNRNLEASHARFLVSAARPILRSSLPSTYAPIRALLTSTPTDVGICEHLKNRCDVKMEVGDLSREDGICLLFTPIQDPFSELGALSCASPMSPGQASSCTRLLQGTECRLASLAVRKSTKTVIASGELGRTSATQYPGVLAGVYPRISKYESTTPKCFLIQSFDTSSFLSCPFEAIARYLSLDSSA